MEKTTSYAIVENEKKSRIVSVNEAVLFCRPKRQKGASMLAEKLSKLQRVSPTRKPLKAFLKSGKTLLVGNAVSPNQVHIKYAIRLHGEMLCFCVLSEDVDSVVLTVEDAILMTDDNFNFVWKLLARYDVFIKDTEDFLQNAELRLGTYITILEKE